MSSLPSRVVDASLADDVAGVRSVALEGGGLDLHADITSIVFDANVVAGGVAVWTSYAEAAAGGAGHETQLGPFAALFTTFDRTPSLALHVFTLVFPIWIWTCRWKRATKKAQPGAAPC